LKLAKDLVKIYRELLTIIDEARREHHDKDYFEKLVDALDAIGSALTRMRARGILDPEMEKVVEETLLSS